jgi:hypothetical protein
LAPPKIVGFGMVYFAATQIAGLCFDMPTEAENVWFSVKTGSDRRIVKPTRLTLTDLKPFRRVLLLSGWNPLIPFALT